MELAIQLCSYVVGLALELLTIAAMLRGGFRRFPFVFAYVIAAFLTTVLEMPASLAYYSDKSSKNADAYTWWYWRDEAVLQLLIFAVVISLIYNASEKLASRRTVRLVLIVGAVLFVSITFVVHYQPPAPKIGYGEWATAWARDLKFLAAVLDLTLWAMLIASQKKDQRLLILSCALGIMFAGEAIGESVRNLSNRHQSHALGLIGGLLVLVSDLGFLFIWWRAFQTPKPRVAA